MKSKPTFATFQIHNFREHLTTYMQPTLISNNINLIKVIANAAINQTKYNTLDARSCNHFFL